MLSPQECLHAVLDMLPSSITHGSDCSDDGSATQYDMWRSHKDVYG